MVAICPPLQRAFPLPRSIFLSGCVGGAEFLSALRGGGLAATRGVGFPRDSAQAGRGKTRRSFFPPRPALIYGPDESNEYRQPDSANPETGEEVENFNVSYVDTSDTLPDSVDMQSASCSGMRPRKPLV